MTEEKNFTYTIGYIGVIDVLGYGEFTKDEDNFHKIYSLMNHIFYQKRNFERNFEHIKFSVLSDTVVVMVEATDPQKYDYVFFESVLSHIGLVRTFILNCTGLYSRAGITFGKYYYDDKTETIFGPAITKAVKLAEKSDEFIKTDPRFKNRPAAIIIDEVFSKKGNNPYYQYFLEGCVTDWLSNIRVKQIQNTDYYIYNPYFEAFQDYLYTARNTDNYSDDMFFDMFCKRETNRLKQQIENANKDIAEKYSIESELLNDFISNYPKTGPLY